MIGQGEVLIDGTEMSLVSLANVLAEHIGQTKAGRDAIQSKDNHYDQKMGYYPTSTFPGT
jgi:hypothetical protein